MAQKKGPANNAGVTFIRKGGRVIPIRIKEGSALDRSAKSVRKSRQKGSRRGAAYGAAAGAGGLAATAAASSVSKARKRGLLKGKGAMKAGASVALRGVKQFSGLLALTGVVGAGIGSSYLGQKYAKKERGKQAKKLSKKFGNFTEGSLRKAATSP